MPDPHVYSYGPSGQKGYFQVMIDGIQMMKNDRMGEGEGRGGGEERDG